MDLWAVSINNPDSKVHRANMGPIWGQQDPDGPHVGPMKFAIWEGLTTLLEILMPDGRSYFMLPSIKRKMGRDLLSKF